MPDSIVYSRDTSSVQPDYAALQAQGLTVALNANDPNLDAQVQRARANGMNPAIWVPATNGGDPTTYGKFMAGLVQKYGPSAIIPNVEFDGKGYPGSAGAQWSDTMMSEYSKYVPPGAGPPLTVAVMPNQADFNYQAYLKYGGNVQAEAFGSKLTEQWPPEQIAATLRAAGVPDDKISVLLAPGQDPGAWRGAISGYTLDDMTREQLARFQGHAQAAPPSSGTGPVNSQGKGEAQFKTDLAAWFEKQMAGQDPGPMPNPKDYGPQGNTSPTPAATPGADDTTRSLSSVPAGTGGNDVSKLGMGRKAFDILKSKPAEAGDLSKILGGMKKNPMVSSPNASRAALTALGLTRPGGAQPLAAPVSKSPTTIPHPEAAVKQPAPVLPVPNPAVLPSSRTRAYAI